MTNVFNNLFSESETAFKKATDMISNDGMFRHARQRSDPQLIRCVVYDTAPSYTQYADEISGSRGKGSSNLEALDDEEIKEFEGEKLNETSKLAKELMKNLLISPPESPKK